MIDTVKIYTQITKEIYNKIQYYQNHKLCFNKSTGELFYDITSDNLEGSYSTSLSVRVGNGAKYNFFNSYCLEVEGSLHKMLKGQNAYDGFYNLLYVCSELVKIVENSYNVVLPNIRHWFLQRCDISKCFDLGSQENVVNYLASLKYLSYPRRNILSFGYSKGLYIPGTSTTLKIYDKMVEFIKHDQPKLKKFDFDIYKHLNIIKGFVRFECEIKKKRLEIFKNLYSFKFCNRKRLKCIHIRIISLSYFDLLNIWEDEFLKLFKFPINEKKRDVLCMNEDVKVYLRNNAKDSRQFNRLYSFYIQLKVEGYDQVKKLYSNSTFYRNISDLKNMGINWASNEFDVIDINYNNFYYFNPFMAQEVA